jgi:hypothetical protein
MTTVCAEVGSAAVHLNVLGLLPFFIIICNVLVVIIVIGERERGKGEKERELDHLECPSLMQ